MYLTRFPLNLTRRKTQWMLASPYRLHAAIAGCFPPGDSRHDEGRVLWRVDRVPEGGVCIYIVSPSQPSLVGLDGQVGWPDLERQWETRQYDAFLSRIKAGQRWGFRLVANPVVNRCAVKNGQGRSKRLGHLTVLQQAAWLIGKDAYEGSSATVPELFLKEEKTRALRNGFQVLKDQALGVPQLVVSDSERLRFDVGKKGHMSLSVARYDGLLEVTDAELLKHALTCGIGHAKGFGCGLLTLAPIGRVR